MSSNGWDKYNQAAECQLEQYYAVIIHGPLPIQHIRRRTSHTGPKIYGAPQLETSIPESSMQKSTYMFSRTTDTSADA